MPKIIDADVRREAVADAVYRVVHRSGLENASLRTVAQEAGLALGSVRHYFDNQADLMDFAYRTMSERIGHRVGEMLDAMEEREEPAQTVSAVVEDCAVVLEELLPMDQPRELESNVSMAFMLAARTDMALAEAAAADYRGTAAAVGRIILHILDSGFARVPLTPIVEAERLMAVLDGLGLRMILQPQWATPEQGQGTLREHLASLMES